MHHDAMGQGYTSLFFLDEVTALAAGHRPCFFCRRVEAKRFVDLSGMGTMALDAVLHGERISSSRAAWGSTAAGGEGVVLQLRSHPRKDPFSALRAPFPQQSWGKKLPDGAMVELDGVVLAVRGDRLLRWSFGGYTDAMQRTATLHAKLLTPPTIVGILAKGYQPRWHRSALTWGPS